MEKNVKGAPRSRQVIEMPVLFSVADHSNNVWCRLMEFMQTPEVQGLRSQLKVLPEDLTHIESRASRFLRFMQRTLHTLQFEPDRILKYDNYRAALCEGEWLDLCKIGTCSAFPQDMRERVHQYWCIEDRFILMKQFKPTLLELHRRAENSDGRRD